jgi:D-alanyl-D-alanine carboxypeptidase
MAKTAKKFRFNKKERLILKKTVFFVFCLSLFLLPGQNFYLRARSVWQPAPIEALMVDLPAPAAYPVNYTGQPVPWLSAQSTIVVDRDSAVVLFEKNTEAMLLPASTVKIMTALVSLDHYSLDQVLTVEGREWVGQSIELQDGERLTVRALLYALLVASANDAAEVLAANYPGGQPAFVRAMNQKAETLNLTNTHFANPTGLDTDDRDRLLANRSLSTTLDLARLATLAMKDPVFAEIVSTRQILITDITGEIHHPLGTINQLLGQVEGLKGVKTGWTQQAGECLVSFVERDGRGVIIVVLGSQDRFGETEKMVDWVFTNFEWQKMTAPQHLD